MKGIVKRVVMIAVGLLVVFALLVAIIPQIQGSVTGFITVADELVGIGDNVETVFDFTLDRQPVEVGTFTATDETENFTDDGDATLTGSAGGSGTITYVTGVVQLTFFVAPSNLQEITAGYDVEDVPTILTTLANLWWIPLIIVMVGLVMATKTGRGLVQRAFSSRRRRRRRRR